MNILDDVAITNNLQVINPISCVLTISNSSGELIIKTANNVGEGFTHLVAGVFSEEDGIGVSKQEIPNGPFEYSPTYDEEKCSCFHYLCKGDDKISELGSYSDPEEMMRKLDYLDAVGIIKLLPNIIPSGHPMSHYFTYCSTREEGYLIRDYLASLESDSVRKIDEAEYNIIRNYKLDDAIDNNTIALLSQEYLLQFVYEKNLGKITYPDKDKLTKVGDEFANI
jgi:hypothetical protein